MIAAYAEKAAEAQNRIGNAATAFFQDQALDRSDMLAAQAVNCRSLDLVTGDQIMCFGNRRIASVAAFPKGASRSLVSSTIMATSIASAQSNKALST